MSTPSTASPASLPPAHQAKLDELTARLAQVAQLDRLLRYSAASAERAALAEVLADAAMLAGWKALDRGSLALAWQQHEVAKSAARAAGSSALLAYATGQQAFVLVEMEMFPEAVQLLEDAESAGRGRAAGLLRAWVAALRRQAMTQPTNSGNRNPGAAPEPGLPHLAAGRSHNRRTRATEQPRGRPGRVSCRT